MQPVAYPPTECNANRAQKFVNRSLGHYSGLAHLLFGAASDRTASRPDTKTASARAVFFLRWAQERQRAAPVEPSQDVVFQLFRQRVPNVPACVRVQDVLAEGRI